MGYDTIKMRPQGGHDPLACGTARRCHQAQDRARLIAEYRIKRLDAMPVAKPVKASARVFSRIPYQPRGNSVRIYVPA